MIKYVLFLLLSVILCLAGAYEHMTDVVMLCLISAVFFTLKIRGNYLRRHRKHAYMQRRPDEHTINGLMYQL